MSSPLSNTPEEAAPSEASAPLNDEDTSSAGSANQDATQDSNSFVTVDDILAIENEVAITSGSEEEHSEEGQADEEQNEDEHSEDEEEDEEEEEDEDEQVEESTTESPSRLSFPLPLPLIGETGRGFADAGQDRDIVYDVVGEVSDYMQFPLVVEVVPHAGEEGTFIPVLEEDLLTSEEYWGPHDGDSGLEAESNSGDEPRERFPVPSVGQELVWGWWATSDGRLMKGYGRVVNTWVNVVKAFVFAFALEHLFGEEDDQQLSDIDELPEGSQEEDQ
ncbi:hypothetical protein ASPVEDRAFT_26226 [Aspergillus versicolor CBS 583.65]|uniref:Uncharacterized protein n=1 Tax=Aspergillus versicolor CBS 583.65 TaxID=1036611 RepID=A0A1L9PCZ5_ASPVE|nr:uncharacterized protein ASPVEDRAFT_26226 [Aspergillus versicolor CBS 583.65]OJI99407.1 hypothetical protein ASPVEDRAFT_26226 [Aspergillus versicolor CBS 583.65]